MVDKTDMNDLLASLERVCLEYQGMKYLLDHPPVDELWRPQLTHYRNVPEFASQGEHRFDEAHDALQFAQPDAVVFASLRKILDTMIPSK